MCMGIRQGKDSGKEERTGMEEECEGKEEGILNQETEVGLKLYFRLERNEAPRDSCSLTSDWPLPFPTH